MYQTHSKQLVLVSVSRRIMWHTKDFRNGEGEEEEPRGSRAKDNTLEGRFGGQWSQDRVCGVRAAGGRGTVLTALPLINIGEPFDAGISNHRFLVFTPKLFFCTLKCTLSYPKNFR